MSRPMFWMVLGSGEPVYRHLTLASATSEAERLARENHGRHFTVLASVCTVQVSAVQWTAHGEEPQSGHATHCTGSVLWRRDDKKEYEFGSEIPF
jgi:hypothetical protein